MVYGRGHLDTVLSAVAPPKDEYVRGAWLPVRSITGPVNEPMPQAKLVLTIPEGVWIGDLSRDHPDVRFRVLAAVAGDEAGTGLAQVNGPDLDDVISAMSSFESVTDLEVLQATDDRALVQFETSNPLLLMPVKDSGIALEMPFEISNGEAVWEITAPQDRLSDLGEQLSAFGISFTVESIQQRIDQSQLLTDEQRRLIEAAVDHGYYDTPRECSLTELADELGLAKSTVSETLHRAEGAIIKRFSEQIAVGD